MGGPLSVFQAALAPELAREWADDDAFERAFRRAVASHPDLDRAPHDAAFARALARIVSKDGLAPDEADSLQVEDLGCAVLALGGVSGAVGELDGLLREAGRAVARTMSIAASDADEALQVTRTKLLVADADKVPALASYSARGRLRAWMASVLGQEALRIVKARAKEVPESEWSDIVLDGLERSGGARFAAAFRVAFHDAFARLAPEDRRILKLSVVDGMTAEGIGQTLSRHRVTIARRLGDIRAHLVNETRARLAKDLSLSPSSLSQELRDHMSELDVSLTRVLREDAADPGHPPS